MISVKVSTMGRGRNERRVEATNLRGESLQTGCLYGGKTVIVTTAASEMPHPRANVATKWYRHQVNADGSIVWRNQP